MTNVIRAITYSVLVTNWVPVDFKGPSGLERRDIGIVIEETYIGANIKGTTNIFLFKSEIKEQPLIRKRDLEAGTLFTPNFNFPRLTNIIWQP